MMSQDELAAWLRLAETPGVGPVQGRRLLAAFGSPERVFEAEEAALREVAGAHIARALLAPDAARDALAAATNRWREAPAAGSPRHVIALGDPAYPPALLQTVDPPLLLYAIGRLELLHAPAIALVGSRNATPQGIDNARAFAHHLSERGLAIVSGLALGIDGAAHEGGLAGRGSTIAFVGTGLDQCYPRRHEALARRIGEQGLLVSEYPLGTPPLAPNFPRRNRLIAGVSQGTLVIEAALPSGSLITARLAAEAGREVFAIPGSIHSPQARGCHWLIRQGAKLVETADDVLQELPPADGAPRGATMSPPQRSLFAEIPAAAPDTIDAPDAARPPAERGPDAALLDALGHDPVTFDALAARTGLPSDRLSARLLELELAGLVQRLPGGLFQRRAKA